MSFDDRVARNEDNSAELLANHFSPVFSTESSMNSEVLDFFASQLPNGCRRMTELFHVFETPKALRHFDANKGSGLDGFSSTFYKKLVDAFVRPHYNF